MADPHLLLGVTRKGDDPAGPVTGLIYRDGEKLRFGALPDLFKEGATARFVRLVPGPRDPIAYQVLERVEYTVNQVPRFLFKREGKLEHQDLRDVLQFSEAGKALLKPQALAKPLQLGPLSVAYLEVSRLSDVMRQEMLGGERALGQLGEVLALPPTDAKLSETLYELARRNWLTVHELGKPAENAIALNRPVPAFKG